MAMQNAELLMFMIDDFLHQVSRRPSTSAPEMLIPNPATQSFGCGAGPPGVKIFNLLWAAISGNDVQSMLLGQAG
jgi:hypothetical protein